MHYVRWLLGVLLVAVLVGCGSDQPDPPSETEANEIINKQLDKLLAASTIPGKPSGVDATCVRTEDSERTYECNGTLTFQIKAKKKSNSREVASPFEFGATVGGDNAVISRCRGTVAFGANRCTYIGVIGDSAVGQAGGHAGPKAGAAGAG